jgi:5-formyltetrahydrofolate cyclo-ligase
MSGAIVDDVPTDEYDRRVDAICTKDEFITIE